MLLSLLLRTYEDTISLTYERFYRNRQHRVQALGQTLNVEGAQGKTTQGFLHLVLTEAFLDLTSILRPQLFKEGLCYVPCMCKPPTQSNCLSCDMESYLLDKNSSSALEPDKRMRLLPLKAPCFKHSNLNSLASPTLSIVPASWNKDFNWL